MCDNAFKSLNYIKQLRLKDDLRLKRGFSMETLRPYEYDILLVRGGHLEGNHSAATYVTTNVQTSAI